MVCHIYIDCGVTDFRKQIDSLSALASLKFNLDPFTTKCLFIFCNKSKNSIKVLKWDDNGFILLTKKLVEASAIGYSIVETAKANNLNVFQYLSYLFKSLPNINFTEHPQLLEQYLPWGGSLPECCYNKKNKEKDEESA